jgi:hypothetical protein
MEMDLNSYLVYYACFGHVQARVVTIHVKGRQHLPKHSEVLWKPCLGTHCELGEHIGNLMRTHWTFKGA